MVKNSTTCEKIPTNGTVVKTAFCWMAVLFGLWVAWVLASIVYVFAFRLDESYEQAFVARSIVKYMRANSGKFPGSWDDIPKAAFLADRIWVDFDADAFSLAKQSQTADSPNFTVVGGIHPFPLGLPSDRNGDTIVRQHFRQSAFLYTDVMKSTEQNN